jgi:sugar lactone lactonase YvrE
MTRRKITFLLRQLRSGRAALVVVGAAAVLLGFSSSPASAGPRPAPRLAHLAQFAALGSGSTIGPDGALYVTDGASGSVDRIDPSTGAVSVYATGLPPKVQAIGGAMDVAFLRDQAYALVTLVGGDIVGGPHLGDAVVGIYRLDGGAQATPIADIGAWSVAHPPGTGYFVTTGVQYAMAVDRGSFLVTDGHHNRVLRVSLDGSISEMATFGNVVPTGLEVQGDRIWVSQAGPVPHVPDTGRVLTLRHRGDRAEVARGASLLIDVELGPRHQLYALSQGQWDEVMEGSPALPNTGRLERVTRSGGLEPVVDARGQEIVLDRPTSVEFVARTAYIVSLSGDVYTVQGL